MADDNLREWDDVSNGWQASVSSRASSQTSLPQGPNPNTVNRAARTVDWEAYLQSIEPTFGSPEAGVEPEPLYTAPRVSLLRSAHRGLSDLLVVAPACYWLLGVALLHAAVGIYCGGLHLAALHVIDPSDHSDHSWLNVCTLAPLKVCALALVLGGLFMTAQLAVGLACEAQYELFVATALSAGLSVTALLMPMTAPDASSETAEGGTYPKELALGLSFWLGLFQLALSAALVACCRHVHRSFGWRGLKRFGASRAAGSCRAISVHAWPLLRGGGFG